MRVFVSVQSSVPKPADAHILYTYNPGNEIFREQWVWIFQEYLEPRKAGPVVPTTEYCTGAVVQAHMITYRPTEQLVSLTSTSALQCHTLFLCVFLPIHPFQLPYTGFIPL